MKDQNQKWLPYAIQAAIAAVIAILSAKAFGFSWEADLAWQFRNASDGLFVAALLFIGFGLLMWVSTTGFFDMFSYGFSSLLVLFTALKDPKEHKHFYEYKMEKEAKREGKGWQKSVLYIGLICLALSVLCLGLYYYLGGA